LPEICENGVQAGAPKVLKRFHRSQVFFYNLHMTCMTHHWPSGMTEAVKISDLGGSTVILDAWGAFEDFGIYRDISTTQVT
jgi:hypothetical protein